MALPLPRRQADLLVRSPNLSLTFDRGYAGYDAKWAHTKANPKRGIVEGKTAFLRAFVTRFNDPNEYGPFLARREAALADRSAISVEAISSSPLLVGLGRWNPTELGFNFDRFTGCPYIPGSSVKGLLRETARLVGAGEIEDSRITKAAAEYWKGHVESVFGRGTGDSSSAPHADEAGSVCFYDAYPVKWPGIELDVMTPHAGAYYAAREPVAADWEDPVPVHFLRIPAKTTIRFWFGKRRDMPAAAADPAQIGVLLPVALDWLGVGAKKSSGYGWFAAPEADTGRTTVQPATTRVAKRLEWNDARLQYNRGDGSLTALHGSLKAHAKAGDVATVVPAELLTRLKDKNLTRPVFGDVDVEELGNGWKIVAVRSWKA
jgi:CRISPR-associated protein Cmr6